jgi:hypothetical protein
MTIKLSMEPILLLTKEEEAHIVRAAIGGWMHGQVHWNELQDDALRDFEERLKEVKEHVEVLEAAVMKLAWRDFK